MPDGRVCGEIPVLSARVSIDRASCRQTKRCQGVYPFNKTAAVKMLSRPFLFFFTHICALAGIPVAMGVTIRGNPTCFSSLQALARMQTYSNQFQPGSGALSCHDRSPTALLTT